MAVYHVTKGFLLAVTLLALLQGLRGASDRPIYHRGASSGVSSNDHASDPVSGGYRHSSSGYRPDYGRRQYGPTYQKPSRYGGYSRHYGYGYPSRSPGSSSDSSSSSDCVSVQPAHQRYNDYASSVKAASCEAMKRQENRTQAVEDRVMDFGGAANAAIDALSERLDRLEDDVDDIQGVGEQVFLVIIAVQSMGTRALCQVNNLVEVSELCRIFTGARIPDPFFFHLPCDDPKAQSFGITCSSNVWLLQPNCFIPNGGSSFQACLSPAPPGFICNNIALLSCTGYTQGAFASDDLERVEVKQMRINMTSEDMP